jgi:hypothetical protein
VQARLDDRRPEKGGLFRLVRELYRLHAREQVGAIAAAVQACDGTVEDDLTLVIIQERQAWSWMSTWCL